MRVAAFEKVLLEIIAERNRQDQKFGDVEKRGLSPEMQMAILGEEFGECCRAILDKEPKERLREELIQLSAAAAAFVEAMEP